MGDAGNLSMETGSYGLAGLNAYKDVLPRAGGAEQAWDDTDGDAFQLAQAAAANMLVTETLLLVLIFQHLMQKMVDLHMKMILTQMLEMIQTKQSYFLLHL
jgi:hypothetical protein